MVAGAVANLQGIAKDLFGVPLLPFQIRSLLRDTGSPQLGENTKENHIGPRPDLRAAVARLEAEKVDLFFLVDLSGSFADDLPEFKKRVLGEPGRPGIIDRIKAARPNTRLAGTV